MIYECERRLRVEVPIDVVWDWMSDVRRVLSLNIFHAEVDYPEPVIQAGVAVPVRHNIAWLYRQTRLAHIRIYRPYTVAWDEVQAHGIDRFPHRQSLTLESINPQACVIVNRLRGQFRLGIPGGRYWFMPIYRRLAPRVLNHENRQIAAAVGGLSSDRTSFVTGHAMMVNGDRQAK